jgi:uncharacterized protein YbjT (DUF2867 family)
MYVVTGATGHIGKVITEKLLSNGQKVRVIGRDEPRLKPFMDKGAEAFVGSADDAAFLKKAFAGATAVFTMIPPDVTTPDLMAFDDRFTQAYATALSNNTVKYVVDLSSIGGEQPNGTGPIVGLHHKEEKLKTLGINVLSLRPGFFMENFLFNIPIIKSMGINGSSLKADIPIPMIATRDIGNFAADALLQLKFTGNSVQYLVGPRNVTCAEATRILGTAIGKPDLQYVQFSYEDAERGMIAAGISANVAQLYNQMNRAFNEGSIKVVPGANATKTQTSIEDFAPIFAAAFRS